jgi:tRNA-splicing ligase RtcB
VKASELISIGYRPGPPVGIALRLMPELARQMDGAALRAQLEAVAADPARYLDHPQLGELARAVRDQSDPPAFVGRTDPAPYAIWGQNLEPQSVAQMDAAVRLPIAIAGALMPDAHLGYGLPIGGVLATDNAVIPYAVGVDIACRMRLTVFDVPADRILKQPDWLSKILQQQTLFGTGASFRKPYEHDVLEEDWTVTPVTRRLKDKARELGSSGSGNHFAEFGTLTLTDPDLGLEIGTYLAFLTHSGSRGSGAQVASHYSRLAIELHPELPQDLRNLAWLGMDTDPGRDYWAAMNLMGRYAAANHEIIHKKVAAAVGGSVLAGIENHHNFAWIESHGGRDVVVHRKGATPAGAGVLGVIPGSMATPGFVVRGKGNAKSLRSASHGAGRVMSRTAARNTFRWNHVKPTLEKAGVTLLSAGIDEAPGVYKDIHAVMAAQSDLVEVIARFDPKIVKMAESGEKPED